MNWFGGQQSGIHFLDAKGPDGMRLYAIGDVHGRLDLLRAMHEAIAAEVERDRPPTGASFTLAIMSTAGRISKGVIEFLADRSSANARVITLAGNHDVGFADFLAMPDSRGLFANWGGDATARSYGVEADFRDVVRLPYSHAAWYAPCRSNISDFLRIRFRSSSAISSSAMRVFGPGAAR
jgi:serine/threonine protein phosphatase 1